MSQIHPPAGTAGITGCPYFQNAKREKPLNLVADHARFFADADDKITGKSQVDGYHSLDMYKSSVIGVNGIASTALNILSSRGLEPNPDNMSTFRNPASTGIWDENGNFNEARFSQLAMKAELDRGKEVITRQSMQDFLDETWVNKPEANNIATRVFLVVPVSYKDVTKRSIKDLFAHFHDHWYRNPQGNFEGAFTVAHLRKFYTDPNAVIDMRLRGLIPPPKPVAQNPVAMALHLVHDPLSLKTKYLLESCNANTCAWVTLAVAKAQVLDKRVTSLDCKNFPPKNPDRPFTTKFGFRFPNHDSILPEDSYDLEGTAARTVVRYFNKMEFTDVEGFFPDSYAEMQSILDVFPHHTLPVARTVWANWDSEQTLSN